MNQTRLESAVEAALNVLSGFLISWSVWVFLVAPLFNLDSGMGTSLAITSIFTVSSLLRSYLIRRFFNGGMHKVAHAIVKEILT